MRQNRSMKYSVKRYSVRSYFWKTLKLIRNPDRMKKISTTEHFAVELAAAAGQKNFAAWPTNTASAAARAGNRGRRVAHRSGGRGREAPADSPREASLQVSLPWRWAFDHGRRFGISATIDRPFLS